jgi:murein DD-endopeptidase MepM/ murein hydrolase activator NlpD
VISGPVSSPYGWRKDPIDGQAKFHSGTDVPMPVGSDVHAASDGRVTFVGERTGYGLTVEITHANGLVTRYAHLSASDVQPGDIVSAGQVIAASGNSGRSTGPHLHFEVMDNGQPIDPQGAGAVKLAELRRQSPD